MEVRPAIVAPVSRSLAVADTARSAAFYGDVLGFEIHQGPDGTEAASGPGASAFRRPRARIGHRVFRDRRY